MSARKRLVALATLLAATLAVPAAAQDAPVQSFTVHQAFAGILSIAGKQMPLPEGEWRVAGYRRTLVDSRLNFGAYGVIHNLVLFRAAEGRVDAKLELNVNALPVTDGWGISKECEREDLYAVIGRYKSGWDASCIFLLHTQTATGEHESAAWAEAAKYARDRKLEVPPSWVTAGFRIATRSDVIDARFSFNPATRGAQPAGGGWEESPWHKSRFESDPAKVALVSELARWAGGYAHYIELGMKNRLLVREAYPMPFGLATPPEGIGNGTAERLQTLDRLYAAGALAEEDYRAQRELIATGKADEPVPQPEATTIALWKTIAYRPMVSTANIFIDYYWVGSPFATGVLVILQVLVNTTKFYFHEVAWERFFGAAAGKRDAPLVVDFTYSGITS